MALAQLSIDLVAKVASFERDLKRAADATVAQSNRMGAAFGLVKGGLAGLATGLSVGAFVSLVGQSIDAVDALNDVSDATGASVENISALEGVAKRTGANMDTVTTSLVKFNGVLKDADPTKGPGAVLKALGLSIAELKRQDPAEAMRQVAVAFQGITSEGDKARVVQELFGKSVKDVAPWLKDLAESGKLNAKVTTAQAQEAEKFNKELFKLQANASDAARSILLKLVPVINRIFDDVRTLGDKASLAGLAGEVVDLAKDLKNLQSIKATAIFVPADIDRQIAEVSAKLAAAKKVFNAADPARVALNVPQAKPGPKLPDNDGKPDKDPRKTATPKDPYAEAKRYLENLTLQVESTRRLSVYEKLLTDLQVGRLGKTTPAIEADLKATAKQVDTLRELAQIEEVLTDNDAQAAAKTRQKEDDRQRLLQGLLDATPTVQIERQREAMLTLTTAYEAGELGITGSTSALQLYTEAAQAFLGITGETAPALEELAASAIRASERIQDALGDTLVDMLGGKFDNIGDKFASLIQRMVAEAAAARIMDSLFGAVGKDGKRSSDGALSGVFEAIIKGFSGSGGTTTTVASAKGNVFAGVPSLSAYSSQVVSKPTLFPFAKGGTFAAAGQRVGLMGEAGAEAIMPLRRGPDGRLGVSAQVGGGEPAPTINQYFTVGDVASLSQVRQAVAGSEARIAANWRRSQKYGGAAA